MDRALYVAANAATLALRAQAANSNNLANATTTGFRAEMVASEAMPLSDARQYSRVHEAGFSAADGAIQHTGLHVVLGQFQAGTVAILMIEIGTGNQVLMHAQGPVHFAPSPKQGAECQVGLHCVVVHFQQADEHVHGLVRFLVDEVLDALQIIRIGSRSGFRRTHATA